MPLPAVPEGTWHAVPHTGVVPAADFRFLVGEDLVSFYELAPERIAESVKCAARSAAPSGMTATVSDEGVR